MAIRGRSALVVIAATLAATNLAHAQTTPVPCAQSHKGVYYANDFSYLLDDAAPHCLGDSFKLMPVAGGDWGTFDVGGQLRLRYHHEQGMGQDVAGPGVTRFQNNSHDILLTRLRLYTNWQANEWLRIYQEGILADVTDDDGTYLPRPIDRNFGDFLNLFAELKLLDEASVRVGRQELLFGAERLISPLDWANTRRTFDGVRGMVKGDGWSSDPFYTFVVPVDPNHLDEPDYDQRVYGVYNTYSAIEHLTVDAYYIGYDNDNPGVDGSGDFSIHTLGLRLYATLTDEWLFEFEGGPQFGRQSGLGLDHEAGFATAGVGRKLDSLLPWSPTLWCYYDYASGNSLGGDFNRFNQLFPLGHRYFGYIDAVQRSNIEAPNVLLTLAPSEKWNLLVWYWHFMAAEANDIVPSIGGTPAQSTTSADFGDELDLTAKRALGPRSNILFGYSHLWRGSKILGPSDADFAYSQWELNF